MRIRQGRMPNQQGRYDGLCGMYAITNAYQICGYDTRDDEDTLEDIFKTACEVIAKTRWPETLWEGTTFGDMKNMIAECNKYLKDCEYSKELSIETAYPFWFVTPNSNKKYWKRLHKEFENENTCCGIVGVEEPWQHWLVVEPARHGKLLFSDSGDGSMYRVDIKSIHAGNRNSKGKDYRINRRELIIFRRVGRD